MQSSAAISFAYTKASLYALAKVQFALTHFKFKLVYQLVCGVLILIGALSPLPEAIRMVLLMIGCLALPSLHLPVRLATDRVCTHYGAKMPCVTYRFKQTDFTRIIDDKKANFAYSTVVQLVEDSAYFYIVDNRGNVFFVDPVGIGDHKAILNFKDLLAKKTNLNWGHLRSAWNVSIYTLLKKK